MKPTAAENNGATDVAAPTAPNTNQRSDSTLPPNGSAVKTVRELRAIRKNPDSTLVGFYDDPHVFDQYARECNELGYSIYSPINPLKADVREHITLNQPPCVQPSAGDVDIAKRVILPCDFDCERPKGTPATEEQRAKAKAQAEKLVGWFKERGVTPELVDSGNGFHVLVHIDLPNDEESSRLVRQVLQVLSKQYSVPSVVKLDTVLHNASRILRVPGHRNCKDSAGRVCVRLSTGLGIASRELLEEIAGETTAEVSRGVVMPVGWDAEVELPRHGLRFERRQDGACVSFDYYEAMGCCLLADRKHEEGGPRKSRFLWNPATRTICHQCFAAGCQEQISKTPTALARLGINVDQQSLEEKLREMNERYCYVDETDCVVRLAGMRMYDSQRFANGGHLANQFHVTADGFDRNGKPKVKKERLAKLWLESIGRTQVERIVYEPGYPRFFEDSVNRWQEMGVEPEPGSVQPWSELLAHLVPDEKARKWFEQWCAYPLQNLGAKLKSAVILWGVRQGTGKTTLANTIMRIYGRNAAAITESHLHAPFNEWALDKQFICADEITAGDKRSTADNLKEWIAGHETIRINQKFQPEIVIRNCINFLFTSNHPNSFYLETTDRRYFVVEVPEVQPERAFFDAYYGWLDSGGPAFLYHHLLHLPLADFHPHAAPLMTEAKEAMIDIGKSDLDRWLEERRENEPDLMQPAEKFLTEFQARQVGYSQVKVAGMTAALRRLGAVDRQVKIGDSRKLRLWCLNSAWRDREPYLWAEHYQKASANKSKAAISDADIPTF
jgi:hypothetical protein